MSAAASPIAFAVHVARLPQNGMPVEIEPDAKECAALAAAHGLLGILSFRANLLVTKWQGRGVKVAGTVKAEIEQACVVTLEPVRSKIDEPIEQIFLPPDSRLARIDRHAASELVIDAEGPDLPETLEGGTIDVGALAEEFFALGIDPYPRAPGASVETGAEPVGRESSPFSALARLPKS